MKRAGASRSDAKASAQASTDRLDLQLSPAAMRVVEAFEAEGADLFAVGGCVRDRLLGLEPKDVDFTTPMKPERIAELLRPLGTVYDVGIDHGTVAVNIDGEDIEVTTFRTEVYPDADSRRPEASFDTDLDGDLERRDFTMNAIAAAPDGTLYDPHGGRSDLDLGVVAAVGSASDRFDEDPLRIVRGARFAAVYDLEIEDETSDAMWQSGARIDSLPAERITAEVDKVLQSKRPSALVDFVRTTGQLGLSGRIFGAKVPLSDLCPRRPDDLYTPLARAAALHRVGVDLKSGLKFPHAFADSAKRVDDTVTALTANRGDASTDTEAERTAMVNRAVRDLSEDELSAVVQNIAAMDAPPVSFPLSEERERLREPLPVNGNDAMAAGLSGKAIGEALAEVEQVFLRRGGDLDRQTAEFLLADAAESA